MEIVKATPGHARRLAHCVRKVDRMEWEIATGQPFLGHLLAGLLIPESSNWTLQDDGEVLAVFGVHPWDNAGVGRAWFAGSDLLMSSVHRAQKKFHEGIAELHKRFPVLVASSWGANTVHHEWMKRMGFGHVGFEEHRGRPFLVFTREA